MKDITKVFRQTKVRIKLFNGEPYFVAADVCRILGMKNTKQALSSVVKDDIILNDTIDSMGRVQKVNYVNESGLYDLVLRSRKKEALNFRRWVTSEVLPTIRKTGSYSIPKKLKDESTKNRKLLASEWKKCGITNEYGYLTIEEYRQLQFDKEKRKKDLNENELLLLNALEAMEMLNLRYNPVEGFIECMQSLQGTASKVLEITRKEEIE